MSIKELEKDVRKNWINERFETVKLDSGIFLRDFTTDLFTATPNLPYIASDTIQTTFALSANLAVNVIVPVKYSRIGNLVTMTMSRVIIFPTVGVGVSTIISTTPIPDPYKPVNFGIAYPLAGDLQTPSILTVDANGIENLGLFFISSIPTPAPPTHLMNIIAIANPATLFPAINAGQNCGLRHDFTWSWNA